MRTANRPLKRTFVLVHDCGLRPEGHAKAEMSLSVDGPEAKNVQTGVVVDRRSTTVSRRWSSIGALAVYQVQAVTEGPTRKRRFLYRLEEDGRNFRHGPVAGYERLSIGPRLIFHRAEPLLVATAKEAARTARD